MGVRHLEELITGGSFALRITVSLEHTHDDLDEVLGAFKVCGKRLGLTDPDRLRLTATALALFVSQSKPSTT